MVTVAEWLDGSFESQNRLWQELSLKKKMYDEAQILYSSTNSISLK